MTGLARRIGRNTGAVFLATALGRAVSLVAVILAARYLREERFGLFSFVFAYVEVFAIFTDLGINTILVREIARDRSAADRLLGAALSLRLFLSLAVMLGSCALISVLPYPVTTRLLVYLASIALFISFRLPSFRSLFEVVFQAELAMRYPAFLGLLSEILAAVAILAVIALDGGLVGLVAVQVLASVPGFLLLIRRFRRSTAIRWTVDADLWLRILRESLPLALTGIFVLVYSRVDVLMLSLMKGYAEIGYYAAAYRLTGTLGLIPAALLLSLYPLMCRYYADSADRFRKIFQQGLDVLVLMAAPVAMVFSAFSEPIVRLVYGVEFLPSAPALVLLGWTAALNFLTYLVMAALNAMNRQSMNAVLTCCMVVLNIAANAVLIPRYGFLGASVATLGTEAAVVLAGFAVVARSLGRISLERSARYCAAAGLAGILLYLVRAHPGLQLFLALFGYGALVLLLKGLTRDDLAALRAVFVK